jgi:hypothetical protein
MKRFPVAMIAIMTLSQINPVAGNPLDGNYSPTAAQVSTVIPNVPARVSVPRIPRFKLLRANPYRLTHIINDNSDDDYIDDDSLITSYRREDLTKLEHTEVLPEHIRWRLFLARQLALLKYNSQI